MRMKRRGDREKWRIEELDDKRRSRRDLESI
jgi:hypothetical protein